MRRSHYVFIGISGIYFLLALPFYLGVEDNPERAIGRTFGDLIIPGIIYGVYLLLTRKPKIKKTIP